VPTIATFLPLSARTEVRVPEKLHILSESVLQCRLLLLFCHSQPRLKSGFQKNYTFTRNRYFSADLLPPYSNTITKMQIPNQEMQAQVLDPVTATI